MNNPVKICVSTKSLLLLLAIANTYVSAAQIGVTELLLENKKEPKGIISNYPRMTWILSSDRRGSRQTAYEIRVALSEKDLKQGGDRVWNSGKISSGQSVHIRYNGDRLESGQTYSWQVRVWDNRNRNSGWSKVAQWQMGLLDPEQELAG